MLEVLVMKLPHSEHWALPGVSQAPYLSIPLTACILATRSHWQGQCQPPIALDGLIWYRAS